MNLMRVFDPSAYAEYVARNAGAATRYISERWEARSGVRKLAQISDAYREYRKRAHAISEQLKQDHEAYLENVSTADMAASLEVCTFLVFTCETLRPARILDLGSGFSSFVFRSYAASREEHINVVSVDDDVDWLEKTRQNLETHGLDQGHLLTWDGFADTTTDPFDLIFHDLGSIWKRAETLRIVLGTAKTDRCVVILDDVHQVPYGEYAKAITRFHGFDFISARALTLDAFGRYSAVALR